MSENYNFLHGDAYQPEKVDRLIPCPFCGQKIDTTSPDAIYPITRPDKHGKQVWRAGCIENHGGCGADSTGISIQDAIEKWNMRV